jgi:hypothetical protein
MKEFRSHVHKNPTHQSFLQLFHRKIHIKYLNYIITLYPKYNLGAAATSEPDQLEPLIVKVAPQ